jgi:hypothetical protein
MLEKTARGYFPKYPVKRYHFCQTRIGATIALKRAKSD